MKSFVIKSQILRPHPALRPYIRYYMYFEVGAKGKWTKAGTSPTALPLLSVALETDQLIYKRRGPREPLMFSSHFTKYTPMDVYGYTKIFNVFFQPAGAFQLLGISQKGLNDKVINLSDLLGISALKLKEKLADQTTLAGAHKVIESYLLKKLSLRRGHNSANHLVSVVDQIELHSHHKNVIKEICTREGYSLSKLERHMKEMVGLSPKMFQRISRFNKVLRYIGQVKPPYNWAQIAYDFGYYDQMHFIKDFSWFHGVTPGNLESIASKLQLSIDFSGEVKTASSIFRVFK
jgi:AraC-like DNA-binding protein